MAHRMQFRMTATLLLCLLLAAGYTSTTNAALIGGKQTKTIPPKMKKCKGSKGTKTPTRTKGTKTPTRTKGTKAPHKHKHDDCNDGSPSAAPSISFQPSPSPSTSPSVEPTKSVMPSVMPSNLPSGIPSKTPSQYPSASPTISNQPSISAKPSAAKPLSPWCSNTDGEPPQTDIVISGYYYYSMVYNTDSRTLTQILEGLDDTILDDLIKYHIWCGQDEFKDKGSRSLNLAHDVPGHIVGLKIRNSIVEESRSLLIDGISLNGADTPQPQSQCASSSNSGSCQTFKGDYTLYLREGSEWEHNKAKDTVLETIRDGMNPENGTLVSRNDGVEELRYIGETLDVEDRNVGSGGQFNGNQPMANIGLSSTGLALIAVGSVITIAFIFVATRKRNRHRIERMEEFYEEEQDLFGKGIGLDGMDNETDLMSTDSFRRSRNVHIIGDEDSLEPNNMKLYGLGSSHGPEATRLGQRGDALDVHKCTSATCQICSQRLAGPTFVRSMFPIDLSSAKPRGYAAPDTVEM